MPEELQPNWCEFSLSMKARLVWIFERELLTRLASGLDTRHLAAAMHLSEHTIQDHLKSVFTKTSTHSRRGLLARALG
jgi:DNA-binding NarL/FixJ family response regulator